MDSDPALSALIDALYADLRRIARRERFRASTGATLCTTALVSEAWIKLQRSGLFRDQQHFLATAALAMRQVLADDAARRRTAKRDALTVALDSAPEDELAGADAQLLQVNDAVERLATLGPRLAKVVECRYFAGYSEAETALALGINERTVRRDWVKARAWLYRELGGDSPLGPGSTLADA